MAALRRRALSFFLGSVLGITLSLHVTSANSVCQYLKDSTGPAPFCPILDGEHCCSSDLDELLAARFAAFGAAARLHPACAAALRTALCLKCEAVGGPSHAATERRSASGLGHLGAGSAPCGAVYEACRNVRLEGVQSPRQPADVLAAEFPTEEEFAREVCRAPAAAEQDGGREFSARLVFGNETDTRRLLGSSPKALCFEKVNGKDWLNLAGHPAGAAHVVVGNQAGLMKLATVGRPGTKTPLTEVGVFLDLTSRVLDRGERGLLSFAFHPNFLHNGRFFVSYICDGNVHKDCQGPCMCTSAHGCTVGQGGASCNGNTVVAEYHVSHPRNVDSRPNPREARRLFTYGRPFSNHNGGDLFFGISGNLYITSGDGGNGGDPYSFAQSGNTFLGKILRVDVDNIPAGRGYGIPASNPFRGVKGVFPEIYAVGLRNPWKCSVDSVLGYVLCGDVGQNRIEEVDVILSGRNYGWHFFEGTTVYHNGALKAPLGGGYTPPIFEYAHPGVSVAGIPEGGNCVIGGYVYRAKRNACLQGKYVYADLSGNVFVATIYPPKGQPQSTAQVSKHCSPASALACDMSQVGAQWGWGVDNSHDLYMTTSSGIYRITDGSHCQASC